MNGFRVKRAHELEALPQQARWLIQNLWTAEAVGIIGGEPKSCKSFLALDMAVAVATGKPCLRTFQVTNPGKVLLFAAEDALHIVRTRLDGISRACEVSLEELDIHVITRHTIRLDVVADRLALAETVEREQPRLLILDPFVRLHHIDENTSGEVAPLLQFLRSLQRRFQTAVALVHHAKKGAANVRPGQALRGSSEFHAWGDSNLYLRRVKNGLILSVEHRAASAPHPLALELTEESETLALRPARKLATEPSTSEPTASRILAILHACTNPLSIRQIRAQCHLRTQTVVDELERLVASKEVQKTAAGFRPLSA